MTHISTYGLTERLCFLRELESRARAAGANSGLVLVCAYCSARHEPEGCPCGRSLWLVLPAAIALLELRLQEAEAEAEAQAAG
jgi:hypothetical protein